MIASSLAQLSGDGPLPAVLTLGSGSDAVEPPFDVGGGKGKLGEEDPMAQANRGVCWIVC